MKLEKGFLKERLGSMQQLAAIRRTVLQEGKGRDLRCAEVNNGSGLCFNVYPDRGMDIGEANFKGIPLAWITTGGAANPAFYEPENINWLRSWGGGLLTGCGLSNVGGPGEANGDTHGLHGRLSHSPAKEFNTDCSWNSDGLYTLTISGKVVQSRVFGEKFLLHRTISTALGENSITICDKIENLGFNTEPFMLLYHMNFDYPLIDDGTTLEIPEHKVTPQNDIAAAGINEWQHATAPQPGFTEQVFYHDIPADADGFARAKVVNPALGMAMTVAYRTAELPRLVQWKQMGQGEYVMGLEPANCVPEGQNNCRAKGMLRELAPGEIVETCVKLSFEEI